VLQPTAPTIPAASPATIHGPEPITLDGRHGQRWWVHHPFSFTGVAAVDDRLSGFPVAVFLPHHRPAHQTPVLIGLQGMACPYTWNAFLVGPLLDMGVACVLFETPFAGERSLVRTGTGDVITELLPVLEHKVTLRAALVPLIMEAVARDYQTVLALLRERHGLTDERVALFGVSLGTLLSSYAFLRDGVGKRLLGSLGHADLRSFARSYAPRFTHLAASRPGRWLAWLASLWFGPVIHGTVEFLCVLRELGAGGKVCVSADPMSYADRIGEGRPVRFLVGQEDPLVRVADAEACARRFPDGLCYVVPGLAHGTSRFGPTFPEHARFYVATQLGDWAR
jgi:pimeloyl-ACP methyl ester carboxylesterase